MRIYVDRKAAFDIEWGHEHGSFHIGDVHVHVWHKNKKGKWVGRGKGMYDARPMTADEKVKYGGLIKSRPHCKILKNELRSIYNLKSATIIQYTIKGRFMSR